MKTEVLENRKNPLLKREEIKIIVHSEANPSFQDALKLVAEHSKKPEGDIAVKSVKGKFGRKTFLISANIYHNQEDKEAIEPKVKSKEGEASSTKVEGDKK